MSGVIKIIGVGPGHKSCASGQALAAIDEARILAGSQRLLDEFARPWHRQIPVAGDLDQLLHDLEALRHTSAVAVLVSGDTGLYSLASYLEKRLESRNLDFVPGISSVQFMFARLKQPWQDVRIISLHGRDASGLAEKVMSSPITAILTSPQWHPVRISRELQAAGTPDCQVAIGVNLSYPDERLVCCRLSEIPGGSGYGNAVMVVFNETALEERAMERPNGGCGR